MYSELLFSGNCLPSKTLCLTYDDGPGIYTSEIAEFLSEQGIKATFFVVGKYAARHPEILKKLNDLGHLIGNHTYDHPDVTYYQSINGDLQQQIIRTDAVIENYIPTGKIYFRPPYGKWSTEVAKELNENVIASLNHIGPIYWDVGGTDCYYWQQGFSVKEAVATYISDINKIDKGIVLLHDDIADMDVVKYQNKTLELTKQLIPILKEQGYRFIGLDEIETIKTAVKNKQTFKIQTTKGKYVSLINESGTILIQSKLDIDSYFEFVDIGKGKIAIKASNGCYFNNNLIQENIIANNKIIDDNSSFDLIPIASNQFMFRCSNGNFITTNKKDAALSTTEKYMKGATLFSISPISSPTKKRGLKTNIILIKKRLLYIKSKILQA